jgi:hypothetical protein
MTSPPPLSTFQYTPLDHAIDSIRVLEIVPGPDESIIRCRMRHTTMSESSYRCLSYTWLPSHPVHEIEVNGSSLEVGDNLYQFLRAYRAWQRGEPPSASPTFEDNTIDKSLPLWIDAICIDQKTVEERNHQVRQMSSIYRKAQDVMVWLGVLEEPVLEFLEIAKEVNEKMPQSQHVDAAGSQVDEQRDLLRSGLSKFWALPYWNRIWIAQEIILLPETKSELLIFIDAGPVQMRHLYHSLIYAKFLSDDDKSLAQGDMYCGTTLFEKVIREVIGIERSLPELLGQFKRCGCQDKRDRVFALLSLADDEPRISVDYGRSALDLFHDVMEQYKDGKTIDELLLLGAHLIECLELRRPVSDPEKYIPFEADSERPSVELPEAQHGITSPATISVPVWTDAILDIYNVSSNGDQQQLWTRRSMLCIYVVVYDAEDVHVFEYAVEEDDAFVIVKYARMHEFVHGQPKNLRCHGMLTELGWELQRHDFFWLALPSEHVYYYRLVNRTDETTPAPLKTWIGPKYHARPVSSSRSEAEEHKYLGLANRVWVERIGLIAPPINNKALCFPDAQSTLSGPALIMIGCIGDTRVVFQGPPIVRGTLIRLDEPE